MSWKMTTYDNPYIDPAEIDDAKRDLPLIAFNQEYLAEFADNAANPFRPSVHSTMHVSDEQFAACGASVLTLPSTMTGL